MPQAALGTLAHGTGDSSHSPVAEEDVGTPTPAPGLLQVTERRRKYRGPAWPVLGGRVHVLCKHAPGVVGAELFKLWPCASFVPSVKWGTPEGIRPGVCLGFTQSAGSSLGLEGGSWGAVPMTSLLPPEPLSSVSSLEVHFDLLDLTELTDMSDQELAEVFADSDDEQLTGESPAGGAGAGAPSGGSGVLRGDPGARGHQMLLLQTRV